MSDHVRFEIEDERLREITWIHNEHLHGSETPLIQDAGLTGGGLAADGLPRSIFVNGYAYDRDNGFDLSQMPLREQDEAAIATWRERWVPAVAGTCRELESFDPAKVAPGGWQAAIDAHVGRFRSTFGSLHMDTMAVVLPAAGHFISRCTELLGDDVGDPRDLLQGVPNLSAERRNRVATLARLARPYPAIAAAVREGRLPTSRDAGAGPFLREFDALIERFGDTTTMHLQDLPTWAEDPARPLAMVATFLATDSVDIDPEVAQQGRRRQAEERLDAAAARRPDLGPLLALLRVARHLVPVSEDHNVLGDQLLLAASRRGWLSVGRHLVTQQRLESPDDVFYLRLPELLDQLEGRAAPFARDVIADRRATQVRWRSVAPPGRLGAIPAQTDPVELGGLPASRGDYTGRARVLPSLDAAATLEPGDVLVVSATGPEWSAYFGLIGALVTDVGGMLTHAAVVAREFGIPAVVGAGDATTRIPDGSTVRVDGGIGRVTIQSS